MLRSLLVLFSASGFCGLIYESIWSHYLKLYLGHAAYGQTVVLIVFIGGLALGAYLTAPLLKRIKRPLLVYAAIELAVGLYAVMFHQTFGAVTRWSIDNLLPAVCSADSYCTVQWLVAGALILPCATLLGTTFPLVTAAVLRRVPENSGRSVALLYFTNSLGAVFGVLINAFVLIPLLGLPGAALTAGLLNITLAACAYFLDKAWYQPDTRFDQPALVENIAPESHGPTQQRFSVLTVLLVTAGLTGLSSFIYEIVWIRSLSLVLGSSTHSFEIMLASFILGLAIGGFIVRKLVDKASNDTVLLGLVQVLMAAFAALTLFVYDRSYYLMEWLLTALKTTDGGYVLYLFSSVGICLLVMLPATICAGMTLPLITGRLLRAGYGESSVGWVYAVNTVGAIAGVILSVHWLMPAIGLKWALLVGAAIDLVLGLVLLRRHLFARAPSLAARLPATTAVAGVAVFVVSAVIFQYDHFKASSGVFRHGVARYSTNVQHLYLRDGKTATVQLQQNDASVRSIRTNGKSDGSIQMDSSKPPASDEPTMTLAGILPLAHAPQSKRAAIIGFGTGMSTATLLAHRGIERVDTIEIEPAMVEAAKHFEPIVTPAYTDPRSRILFDDAKAYFAKSGQKYDIIISEPSNPWVSGISSLFTVEFYRDIKRYLTADGVIAQWIQTYEISEELIASILRALTAEFSSVRVYQTSGGDIIVVASPDRKLAAPVDVWSEYPELSRRLQRVGVRQLSDLDSLYLGSEKVLAALYPLAGVASNSDYFPIVDSGAAKTRFTRASAESLEKLRIAAVPLVEAIDGYSPNRDMKPVESLYGVGALNVSGARRNGQKLVDYILERDDAKAGASPDWDIWAFRRMLNDCSPTDHSKFLRIGAEVAAQVNPQVSADTATSFWARVMASNCAKSIDESERAYLELFKAVGARDGGRIVSLSKTVSQKKTDQFVDEYVSMAGTYGYLLLGDKKSAEDFLKPRWSSLSQARKGSVTFLTLNRLATP